jgi:2-polyprenyl-3-methyl-5-hydroxy-6-metoxy-1,4-benzoquinol methylase
MSYSQTVRRAFTFRLEAFVRRAFPAVALRRFWDHKAEQIHHQWGDLRDDFGVVAECLNAVNAKSVLDVGCGSGRLFPLYIERGISFCGCDLSPVALSLAKARYPDANLRALAVEDISEAAIGRTYDLAISSRVLQHVPPTTIAKAVGAIASAAGAVYVNESTIGQTPSACSYMFGHDYVSVFGTVGFRLVLSGTIELVGSPPQHWLLFKKVIQA